MAPLTRADLSKFQKFIESGDYTAAIKVAENFGLDKDDVYKSQWSASDFGTEAIRDVLSRIEDGMWVVTECEKRVCPTFEAMNALLFCGLKVTEPYAHSQSNISPIERNKNDKTWWFRFKRLRLLQYKDRLDTFIGINNGRYSQNEYAVFRSVPLHKVALGFAERGKTGALSLLFKRHTYSLAPYILEILNSIPESLPPRHYDQLLPDVSPPKPFLPRKSEDLVEADSMLNALISEGKGLYQDENELNVKDSTENMVKLSRGLVWPSKKEIVDWYKERARDIDRNCGLLENSLSLLDLGVGKGWKELETVFEDVSDLCAVVFSSDSIDREVNLRLSDWECLSKFEKFKVILDGATEETAVDRLRERAVPYMIRNQTFASPRPQKNRFAADDARDGDSQSFLLRWLKEAAKENKLSLCSTILTECCREQQDTVLFSSDEELVEVVLDCIYACSRTDEWNLMSSMLTKIPRRESRGGEPSMPSENLQGSRGLRKGLMKAFRGAVGGKVEEPQLAMAPLTLNIDEIQTMSPRTGDALSYPLSEKLEGRVRQAEGHIEAGQLLSQYQVPKPMSFFLACKEDVNATKQLLRILLLKFSNREPAKSDNGWALLWRDLRILQEKAFPFLDKEYILSELCQGILKAGKFSLARNYLKGTGTTILRTEKAEKLVLNAAREYFYSAPDLDSPSIGKARQCLNLLPPSKALTTEINLIDAITVRLPSLGVALLPVQFRQLNDSMKVLKMAISSHAGAYLNIPEIMETAMLLGLSSPDDVSTIEAAIAREAAAAGDFGLARDICLELVRKGHGPIWDLCAALGRGPDFERMDLSTRKELTGFALGHCDEDSVGELLSAWKEFDLLSSCGKVAKAVGKSVVTLEDHEREVALLSERLETRHDHVSSNEEGLDDFWLQEGRHALSCVIAEKNKVSEQSWELFLKEKKKALWFICFQLPWLLEISSRKTGVELDADTMANLEQRELGPRRHNLPNDYTNSSGKAVAFILHALATYDIAADDSLVLKLAQEAMSRPESKGDVLGCGCLLNLRNAHLGAELLEKELERRDDYQGAHQALEFALVFSRLQESGLDLQSPKERRDILLQTFKKHRIPAPGDSNQLGSNINFWSEFRMNAVEKMRVARECRKLQQMLPGSDVGRFISGDKDYIHEQIFSLVDSVKMQHEKWLPKVLTVAEEYNVEKWQILERYFLALLGTDWISSEEIITEIYGYWTKLLVSPDRLQDTLEVYERVIVAALEGLRKEGSVPGADKNTSRFKRTLVLALVSLSSDPTSAMGESFSSDIPEVNVSEMLNKLRLAVWRKLCLFAEDMRAPIHSRIFILELLEAIRNGRAPRDEFWQCCQLGDKDLVISWGKWEAEGGNLESLKNQEDTLNTGNSVNALLALRSTHIISAKWPGWEVTPEVLSSPEAATSFFDSLLEIAPSLEHAKSLKALLEEWESLSCSDHWKAEELKNSTGVGDEKEDWGEDWGEGWEEFSENNWTVHALHSPWKATLQMVTQLGGLTEALSVLDAALLHPTRVLLTEGETNDLIAGVGISNPSAALQLSLLLPYNSAQVHGLRLLEKQLQDMHRISYGSQEENRSTERGGHDVNLQRISEGSYPVNQDIMVLVLSSGQLPSIADDPSLDLVFEALCVFLGHLALQFQELQLSMSLSIQECLVSVDKVPLCAVAFPFFIAELTKAKHYVQAGSLVLQFMRVHPALAIRNAAYMALQRYLSIQADVPLPRRGVGLLMNQGNHRQLDHLRNSMQSLTCRLEEELKLALKGLLKDMK